MKAQKHRSDVVWAHDDAIRGQVEAVAVLQERFVVQLSIENMRAGHDVRSLSASNGATRIDHMDGNAVRLTRLPRLCQEEAVPLEVLEVLVVSSMKNVPKLLALLHIKRGSQGFLNHG